MFIYQLFIAQTIYNILLIFIISFNFLQNYTKQTIDHCLIEIDYGEKI